jgi:uncharacterized membrane protein
MAWTTSDRDALKTAIARGLQTVTLAGESITYQSLADMRELLAEMERELAGVAGTAQSYRLAATSKGF